ncbi:hypothetical protein H4CHR_04384 [Variovorax sp. PBS-H4]|uniref:hypothetical protein n=1 Tax=Variovorax sp. PBS-H4 TaxID=434008 RepID=UPI00131847E5|nr:hypothetical protein [Variovorax sp. PBS-H4]VTU38280.1 hypothetical protein H4CHR_04384 [Variovorax sp. PBS-H4]
MAKVLSEVLAGRKIVPQPFDATIMQVAVPLVLPAAITANDLLELIDLPPGVDLVDYDILSPQLDSNGSPTAAFSLGSENAGGTDLGVVYEAGLTFGRTANGSVSRAGTAAHLAADKSVARRLALKVTTGAATYAGSGKTLVAVLHLRG